MPKTANLLHVTQCSQARKEDATPCNDDHALVTVCVNGIPVGYCLNHLTEAGLTAATRAAVSTDTILTESALRFLGILPQR